MRIMPDSSCQEKYEPTYGLINSLVKTCDMLGIAIWDYLGSRFKVVGAAIIEPLDHYVRARTRPA
jgi:hypothetical protein